MNNKSKNVKLQISRRKYENIRVNNQQEEKLIKELNRDYYRFEKSQQRLKSRSVSIDRFDYNYELSSNEKSPLEKRLMLEKSNAIYNAINSLRKMEKRIFILRSELGLSYEKIANEVNLSKTAVIKRYNAIIGKLSVILKDYK